MNQVPLPLPDPPLRDGVLALRPWSVVDADALAAAWADPDIIRWTGVPEPSDTAAAARWLAGEADRRSRGLALDLVVDLDGVVAGEVGLAHIDADGRSADMGWWVAPAHRGQGLAVRAARLFARWALSELAIDSLTACCHPDNPASEAVARSVGFAPVGTTGELAVWRCC